MRRRRPIRATATKRQAKESWGLKGCEDDRDEQRDREPDCVRLPVLVPFALLHYSPVFMQRQRNRCRCPVPARAFCAHDVRLAERRGSRAGRYEPSAQDRSDGLSSSGEVVLVVTFRTPCASALSWLAPEAVPTASGACASRSASSPRHLIARVGTRANCAIPPDSRQRGLASLSPALPGNTGSNWEEVR